MNQNLSNSSLHEETNISSDCYLYCDEEEINQEDKLIKENCSKMLSSIIQKQIEFFNPSEDSKFKHKIKSKLKLLPDFDEVLDVDKKFISKPQIKPVIMKRVIEPDINEMSETEKIKSVVVDAAFILEGSEKKNWTDRKKSKIMRYKSKTGNPYQFVEPENEFTKIRKKNCWSEKRISRTFKNTKQFS